MLLVHELGAHPDRAKRDQRKSQNTPDREVAFLISKATYRACLGWPGDKWSSTPAGQNNGAVIYAIQMVSTTPYSLGVASLRIVPKVRMVSRVHSKDRGGGF